MNIDRPATDFNVGMRKCLFEVLLVLCFLAGFRSVLANDDGDARLRLALFRLALKTGVCVSLSLWCLYDGRIRGKPLSRIGVAVVFLLAPIAVPVYLIWSRGIRGLWTLLLFASAILAAAGIGSFGASAIVELRK